jgi:hypothetical protein
MNRLVALAFASAPLLASGCMTERVYDDANFLEPGVVAELFGQAGVVTDIEKRFALDATSSSFFAPSDSISVYDQGDQVYASMFVQQDNGRAYVDIEVLNADQMEAGQPYTVQLQQGGAGGDVYTSEQGERGAPTVSVYACPEDLSGPTGQSGNAEEITVTRQPGASGDVFTFQASADNPRQDLFLDGWFRTDARNSTSGF